MKNQEITLYCQKEGWAICFKDKYEFVQKYPNQKLVYKCIGEQYKKLEVNYNGYYDTEKNTYVSYVYYRGTVEFDYIIRDHNGNPVILSDLPYYKKQKRKQALISQEYGMPVPKTGKKRHPKVKCNNAKMGIGYYRECMSKEILTDCGVEIPKVRKKVISVLKDRLMWDDYDARPTYLNEKNWKNYRKNQWK